MDIRIRRFKNSEMRLLTKCLNGSRLVKCLLIMSMACFDNSDIFEACAHREMNDQIDYR